MKPNEELKVWRDYIENFVRKNRQVGLNVLDIGLGESTLIVKNMFPLAKTLDSRTDIQADYVADICGDISSLPNFDLIFCMEVLEHTKEPWKVAKNLVDLLMIGGKLVVTVPCFLFWHPMEPIVGDYWRFLPGHVPLLFDRMKVLKESVCNHNDKHRPLGMCYVLEK